MSPRLRNGPHGYGIVTKTLHWMVFAAIAVQFAGAVRLAWRLATPLPPWAPTLTPPERRLAHLTETTLYAATLAVPVTGLALLLSGDDLLVLHIAAHVVLYAALAAHIGLVLKHQLVDRDRLLSRMLSREVGPSRREATDA